MKSDKSIMNTRSKEVFTFDNVFGADVSTETIFDSQIKDIVQAALDGINQTVFAYGQTSSGKTHTMKGYPSASEITGLIPLSVQHIFRTIEQQSERDYNISVSYIEIYN